MGATFRPIGRSEKLKSSGRRIHGFLAERCQLTRIFGLGSVDRQLTRYTLSTSMIVRRNLFTLSLERNLPVISNQTESNGALVSENNEENVNDFFFFRMIIFELFLQVFNSFEKGSENLRNVDA